MEINKTKRQTSVFLRVITIRQRLLRVGRNRTSVTCVKGKFLFLGVAVKGLTAWRLNDFLKGEPSPTWEWCLNASDVSLDASTIGGVAKKSTKKGGSEVVSMPEIESRSLGWKPRVLPLHHTDLIRVLLDSYAPVVMLAPTGLISTSFRWHNKRYHSRSNNIVSLSIGLSQQIMALTRRWEGHEPWIPNQNDERKRRQK